MNYDDDDDDDDYIVVVIIIINHLSLPLIITKTNYNCVRTL